MAGMIRSARRATFLLLGLAIAGAAQDEEAAARRLFAHFDLTRPHLAPVAELIERGELVRALHSWRDQVVLRLRTRDFGQYGWHGYVIHPRPAALADYLVGKTSRAQFLGGGLVDFVDIYGMAGPPGAGSRVRWFVDINGPIWGGDELAWLDPDARLPTTAYPTFEFAKGLVGRYWSTGSEVYLQKAFELMGDFARHNRDEFWADYAEDRIDDEEVRDLYRCDWRLNTNGLAMGWRMKNFLEIMAGLSKSIAADRPASWEEILHPVEGMLSRADLDRIPAGPLADIALSLMYQHTGKLLWFCVHDGAVPNQRAEGLKALSYLTVIFPDFVETPQLVEYVTRGYEDMLDGNFLPDGGSLEQSFNYNTHDKEGLEDHLRFHGGDPPLYAGVARAKVAARRAVDDGLQTPLGGLPQVGNHHDVLGKNVWESDAAARRYWNADGISGRQPLRPQPYLSKAFRYSGFFAQRSGWDMDALYLFFMAGRPQEGHSMRDANAIQVTAYGRQLLICGGSPTYGMYQNENAKGADFYLDEASSLKNNTVLVDGRSQSKNAPRARRAYKTPVASRWHTSDLFDFVDGLYDLGYGDYEDGRDVDIDMSVGHYREVVFVRPARLWVIADRMTNSAAEEHEYTQVWNFLPRAEGDDWAHGIAGFRPDQFALDSEARRLATTDPDGPNVELHHFGPATVDYRQYYGHRDPWLGWFAAGIGDARPAVDVHVTWRSEDGDQLLTLLIPIDVGQPSPVVSAVPVASDPTYATGLRATLRDGAVFEFLTAPDPRPLQLGRIGARAQSLLVYTGPGGESAGLAVACRDMTNAGRAVDTPAADFEFVLDGGTVHTTPFPQPESADAMALPVRSWPPRAPDRSLDAHLETGLACGFYRRDESIRLYDLMLEPADTTGVCDDWRIDAWRDEREYGVKWQGYLRVAVEGMYRFYLHAPTGARLFIHDPARDLELPAVVDANYRDIDNEGRASLAAGFHRLEIHHMQAWGKPNELTIEVEGPGLPRQELPASWLFRDPR